jgi:integrase
MLADGGNLWLQVTRDPDHSDRIRRSWVFRYELDGQRHDLGLGPVHTLDLADARAKAKTLRQQLLDKIDPLAAKQQAKRDRLARIAAEKRAMTFAECAQACIASHEHGWTNAKHCAQWAQSLKDYAYPVLGDLAVDDITTQHVIKVLEPIWTEIPETASRIRGRIEQVLAWAAVRGFRGGDNPARWRGHLQEAFPSKGKMRPVKHRAALPYHDVPTLMAALRQEDRPSAHALQLLILCAARPGEIRRATRDEFDLAAKVWTVPAGHMKSRKAHRVPLSDRAVEILRTLGKHDDKNNPVFPITEHAMLLLARQMLPGISISAHGFRSSFRDWAAERTNYHNHVVEAALAHAVPDKVEAAYRRTDLFEKRRRLMNEWAAWCARPVQASDGKVVPIGAR